MESLSSETKEKEINVIVLNIHEWYHNNLLFIKE